MLNLKRDLSAFDLNIHGLENRTYLYSLEIEPSFFKEFDQEIIKSGLGKVDVDLIKSTNLIRLNFIINVKLQLECDRTLEIFDEDFNIEESHIYKFGNTEEEISEDMTQITFGTPKINIAQHVFDFVFLAVPMKKIHPKLRTEHDGDLLVYADNTEVEENQEQTMDPRWAALLKLKDKN